MRMREKFIEETIFCFRTRTSSAASARGIQLYYFNAQPTSRIGIHLAALVFHQKDRPSRWKEEQAEQSEKSNDSAQQE